MDNSAAAKIMMASGSLKNFEVLHVTENNYHKKAEHNRPPAWKEVDLDIPVNKFTGNQNGTYKAEDYDLEAWTEARAEIGLEQAEFTQNHTSTTHSIGYSTAVVNLAQTQGSFTENKLYSSGCEGGYNYYSVNVDDHKDDYDEAKRKCLEALDDCAKHTAFNEHLGKEVISKYHDVPAGTDYADVVAYTNRTKSDNTTDIDTAYDTTLNLFAEAYHSEGQGGTITFDLYSSAQNSYGEWIENPNRADRHLAIISVPEPYHDDYGAHVQVTGFEVTDPTTGAYTITANWYNGPDGSYTESGTISRTVNSCSILVGFGDTGHNFGIRPPEDHNYRNWDGDYQETYQDLWEYYHMNDLPWNTD